MVSSLRMPTDQFLLQIVPDTLIIPENGTLEVKITNNLTERQQLHLNFDSFYFGILSSKYVSKHTTTYVPCSSFDPLGDTPSTAEYYEFYMETGDTLVMNIGIRNLCYSKRYDFGEEKKCDGKCGWKERIAAREKYLSDPANNLYYYYDTPEGFLNIEYKQGKYEEMYEFPDEPLKKKQMKLIVKNKSKRIEELEAKFLEIKKDQKRRAKYGEIILNRNGEIRRLFHTEPDVEKYLKKTNKHDQLVPKVADLETYWEKVLFEKFIPKNLEELDGMTDEEIKKMKMEKRKTVLNGDPMKMDFEQLKDEMIKFFDRKCTCRMMGRRVDMSEYDPDEPMATGHNSQWSSIHDDDEKKSKEKTEKLKELEKDKKSEKFKKIPFNPQPKPVMTGKKSVEKNQKKKKANPCCSVS